MEFYISPDRINEAINKLNRMFKHLEHKPTITYNNVEEIRKTTIVNYGENGFDRHIDKIKAIKIEIEDIEVSDWTLVATVQYRSERMLMFDARYFKDIPEQYGLFYTKCDHCGSTHSHRVESHILYNQKTGEWMQVGSTCIEKMINGGKYLNGLMLKLYDVINFLGGCDDEGWHGGWWKPSNKYVYEGIKFEEAMACCLAYMEKNGTVWKKAEWDYGTKVALGTNDILQSCLKEGTIEPQYDETLFHNVRKYYEAMTRGEDDPYDGPSLTQKIIDAFKNDFITLFEMYVAWFAIINYKNSISAEDFSDKVKAAGFEKGQTVRIVAKLEAINRYESYDWRGADTWAYDAIFEDVDTGFKFSKSISSPDVIEKYKGEDGLYRFEGDIKYIAYKKQMIGLGGRLRKQRAIKK